MAAVLVLMMYLSLSLSSGLTWLLIFPFKRETKPASSFLAFTTTTLEFGPMLMREESENSNTTKLLSLVKIDVSSKIFCPSSTARASIAPGAS